MTFMEMINLLDEKHKAKRESGNIEMVVDVDGYYSIVDECGYGRFDYIFCKDDFLATDWIVEDK
jgi:hypothetical protein